MASSTVGASCRWDV